MSEKIMTDLQLLERLREALRPQGTVVVLHLDGARFMKPEFIGACLADFENIIMDRKKLSPMQKLALEVLLDSAYIDKSEIEIERRKA